MIRKAEEKDIDPILSLLKQVLKIHHELRPDLFRNGATKYGKEELLSLLKEETQRIFVYEETGEVIGHLFARIEEEEGNRVLMKEKRLYIDDLVVDSLHQRKGIGKALFEKAREIAKEEGCSAITLQLWEGNEAESFYESLGLKVRKKVLEAKL